MAAKFSIEEIAAATGGALTPAQGGEGPGGPFVSGVSTDTRTIKANEAFFALCGDKHDAHDHLAEAALKGAALLVVSDGSKRPEGYPGAVLAVADTLRAYQDLAAHYRRAINPFVIAVTGSVGKTTLKDMIACILSGKVNACRTKGNLNNQVGLPRTILEAGEDTEAMVLEMGMDRAGEIRRLADIARPDVAVITNIGVSHRGNFDTDDGILNAKYEITAFLGAGGALVIDAGGNAELAGLAAEGSREKGFELICVAEEGSGAAETADYIVTRPRACDGDPGVTSFEVFKRGTDEGVSFTIPAPGGYVGVSACLAAAACSRAGISLRESAEALTRLERTRHRLELIRKDGALVIDDTYNASPDSAKSGLAFLADLPAKRRLAVLADMNDLGEDSEAMHREVGKAAVRAGADLVYAFGVKAMWIADGAEDEAGHASGETRQARPLGVRRFGADEKEALVGVLREGLMEGDAVYIKGSRAMKMEEIAFALTGGS